MSDETKTTVAIIAAIAAAVTSLITLAATVFTQWWGAKTAHALETLKADLARRELEASVKNEALTTLLDSIREALAAIQRIKDELSVVLSAPADSLDADLAVDMLEAARVPIFTTYERIHSDLTQEERDAFHDAKELALNIVNEARKALVGQMHVSGLTRGNRRVLSRLREQLTEVQATLRDSRANRIAWRAVTK